MGGQPPTPPARVPNHIFAHLLHPTKFPLQNTLCSKFCTQHKLVNKIDKNQSILTEGHQSYLQNTSLSCILQSKTKTKSITGDYSGVAGGLQWIKSNSQAIQWTSTKYPRQTRLSPPSPEPAYPKKCPPSGAITSFANSKRVPPPPPPVSLAQKVSHPGGILGASPL